MTDRAPSSSLLRPSLVKALVAALVLSAGVQAWQIVEPDRPGGPPVYVFVSTPGEEPAGPLEAPAPKEGPTPPTATPPKTPEPVVVEEAPKYELEKDFTWEAYVSSTPAAYTPWTGDGVPFILVYYDGLKDAGLKHNAYLHQEGRIGYDLCDSRLIRFLEWTPIESPAATDHIVYQSSPLPENPFNLMGQGENCYTRVLVQSQWKVYTCMEGDGEITPPREEAGPDGVTTQYVDVMDYCLVSVVVVPA